MDPIFTTENLVAFLTLSSLEIVLGIDNLVFLSILTGRLPKERQPFARRIGLLLAMLSRIGLLFAIGWLMRLTAPLFTLPILGHETSGRDLILLIGGLFLIGKATWEIHDKLEGHEEHGAARPPASFAGVMVQVLLIDVVFSLDSVITAVGMTDHIYVMVAAVLLSVGIMIASAEPISRFIERRPTIKILALSFLILIGVLLVAEGAGQHMSKGYVYFAMAFSLLVELLNMRIRPTAPVGLHHTHIEPRSES